MGRGYVTLYFLKTSLNLCPAAGVVGKITKFLAQVIDPRPPNKAKGHDKQKKHKLNGIVTKESTTNGEYITPRAEYLYYEVEVDNLAVEYPESNERSRKWVCLPSILSTLSCILPTALGDI
jgi:hypothetical protein